MKAPLKTTKTVAARRGGRPSRAQAEQIEGQILDVARDLFFTHGYGATSIETIAKKARISKRTFYHRFHDKADIFQAMVHRLIAQMHPPDTKHLFEGGTFEEILARLAHIILQAALSPQALALHRIILAEATRFPELALVMNEVGARREVVTRIAALLERETQAKRLNISNAPFAAEQFLQMIISSPQRRALGTAAPMTQAELKAWAQNTIYLFLNGCRGVKRG